jgi:hypothetical protein
MEFYVVYPSSNVHIMKNLRCWMEDPRPYLFLSFFVMHVGLNVPYDDVV